MDNNTPAIPAQKDKNKKKTILKIVLLLLFFAATFYIIYLVSKDLSGGEIASLKDILKHLNIQYTVLLVFLVVLIFFSDALKYSIIAKIIHKKFDYLTCVNIGIMGRFYDNITPFNTGGQAYQVYQLYKKGYSASESAAIPIVKYVFQLIAWIVVSLVLYIANSDALNYLSAERAIFVKSVTYVGIFVASLAPTLVILFTLFPKATHKVIDFFVKLLCKMKLVKDYDSLNNKISSFLLQYKEAFVFISKNIVGIISLFVICVLDFILVMSIPYFVIMAIGNVAPSTSVFFDVITLNAYSLFAASLVPTPGNSGAIEAAYSMVFSPLPMQEGALIWVVFIWRFCTYYLYILLGFSATIGKFIKYQFRRKKYLKNDLNLAYVRDINEGDCNTENAGNLSSDTNNNDVEISQLENENAVDLINDEDIVLYNETVINLNSDNDLDSNKENDIDLKNSNVIDLDKEED